jgi:hypothetical protein
MKAWLKWGLIFGIIGAILWYPVSFLLGAAVQVFINNEFLEIFISILIMVGGGFLIGLIIGKHKQRIQLPKSSNIN